MEITDIIWMAIINSGAVYLLYRSIWKKKGVCSGCDSVACGADKKTSANKCPDSSSADDRV